MSNGTERAAKVKQRYLLKLLMNETLNFTEFGYLLACMAFLDTDSNRLVNHETGNPLTELEFAKYTALRLSRRTRDAFSRLIDRGLMTVGQDDKGNPIYELSEEVVRPAKVGIDYAKRKPVPPSMRFAVLQRDDFKCVYCGRGSSDGVKLHLDHVRPVALGGDTTPENLVTACGECNAGKRASELTREVNAMPRPEARVEQ